MKRFLGIITLLFAATGVFAIDRSTPAAGTFNACAGKTFVLRISEIFYEEMEEIDNIETYEQVLTYTSYIEECGAISCSEGCDGFVQKYGKTDSPVGLAYGVTLRLYKGGNLMYTFEKNISVTVYPAPNLSFGSNPLSL